MYRSVALITPGDSRVLIAEFLLNDPFGDGMITLPIRLTVTIDMTLLIGMFDPPTAQHLKLELLAVLLRLDDFALIRYIGESACFEFSGEFIEVVGVVLEVFVAPHEVVRLAVEGEPNEDVLEGALVDGDGGRQDVGHHRLSQRPLSYY